MNITFKTKRLKERLASNERLKKEYGRLAKPIGRLMDAIKGMNRRELYNLPGFHELKEQAKGVFAVTIKHPHRLIFSVSDAEHVLILDVVDYHGKNRVINHYNTI